MKSSNEVEVLDVATASTVELVIKHFQEGEGLGLTAYFESYNQKYLCLIDDKWEISVVTVTDEPSPQISFIARLNGQAPMKFSVTRPEYVAAAHKWFAATAAALTAQTLAKQLEATIPPHIVFSAGVTELILVQKLQPVAA